MNSTSDLRRRHNCDRNRRSIIAWVIALAAIFCLSLHGVTGPGYSDTEAGKEVAKGPPLPSGLRTLPRSDSAAVRSILSTARNAVHTNGGLETEIQFAEPVHDFGKLVAGEVLKHEFIFMNTGSQLLEVKNVRSTCGCIPTGKWTRQFDVVQYRLQTEYGAESRLEPGPWKLLRWIAAGQVTETMRPSGARPATDSIGQTVILFTEEWSWKFFTEKNPDITMCALPPRRNHAPMEIQNQ